MSDDDAPLPPSLFKYQPFSTRSLQNLKTRTLWFSSAVMFNDPFDCAFSLRSDELRPEDFEILFEDMCKQAASRAHMVKLYKPDGRLSDEFVELVKRSIASHLGEGTLSSLRGRGIASLAESPTDMLMWAHYADGHRGFCLEFDTTRPPFSKALKVAYRSTLPKLNFVRLVTDDSAQADQHYLESMFLTKASCWEYEREWRVLHQTPDQAYTYPWQALKAVHCGAAMPSVNFEIIALILRDSPTNLFNVLRSPDQFAVTTQPVNYHPFTYTTDEHSGPSEPGS